MQAEENLIISVFGPDGVGKSTLTTRLRDIGFEVFSGTSVASWPDQSWYEELTKLGIDDTRQNTDEHFKEKIRRAHDLARELSHSKGVVIDSDPLHKTLMHDYLRTEDIGFVESRFNELSKIASLSGKDARLHLLLEIGEGLSADQGAQLLQERIMSRGERMPFDPETVDESKKMIVASTVIADVLKRNSYRVVTISTSQPISNEELIKKLKF